MPLKKKKKLTSETKYFFIITSALTKPGHCALPIVVNGVLTDLLQEQALTS